MTKKAGRLLMGAGWLLILVVSGAEPFSAAVYGAEWPLKKVKLEKKQEPAAPEFKSGISQRNLLKLSRPSPVSLPFARVSTAAADTLRILALRVEFQKETPDDPTTTGRGVFDRRTQQQYFAQEGHLVDPTPHDKKYFESHLEALDRFYEAVSNGKLKLASEVWPPVDSAAYQLPNLHNYYGSGGPYADSAIVVQISRFFQDAVRLADSVSPQIDFSIYQSIIIFHAGSSRQDDIFFNSPNDFFTGFLVLGGMDVFTVDTGRSLIQEGLILPESPSQDNRVVGLNASLAHEFGHQLGLVDLYNTRTLITQVGDFSMMDNNGADVAVELDFRPLGGQFVLASSLLPVYPDAWSRAFLGFVDSMVVTRGPINLSVLAAELQKNGTDVVKIPISEQEYFLIENRAVELDTFPPVLKVDSFTNVVLGPARRNASGSSEFTFEYDVLLPGSGLLIWHVDEAVALLDDDFDGFNNFESNTVNTNFQRRFLEVKEADGLVDFGGNYFTGAFGFSEDMYRAGNNNSFTSSSNPSSRSKFGGQTGISVTNIGPADTLMSLSVSSNYLLSGWPQFTGFFTMKQPPALGDLDGDGQEEVLTIAGPFILAWNQDGSRFIPGNLLAPKLALNGDTLNFPFAVFGFDTARISSPTAGFGTRLVGADVDGDGKREVFASSNYGAIWGFAPEDLDNDSLADVLPGFPVGLNADPITCLLIGKIDTFTAPAIFAGTSSMRTSNQSIGYLISTLNGTVLDSNLFNGSIVGAALDSSGNFFVTLAGNDTVFIQRGFRPVWADTILDSSGISEPVLTESDSGLLVAFTTREGNLYLYNGNGNRVSGFPVNLGTTGLIQPIWSTSALSGQPVILLAYDNQIFAYQTNGFLEPDFPKSIDRQRPLAGFIPFLANRTLSGGRMDLLAAAANGNLYFPRTDEREAAFYLGTGTETKSLPAVAKNGRIFARGASDGFLYGYSIAGFGFDSLAWRQAHHDFSGSNFLPKTAVSGTPASALVAEKSFYNYPNPVVGGKTYVRYRLTSPSEATLTVYDMAGNQIYQPKTVPAEVGNDNEVEVDCGGLASGVYLCRLEVNSAGKKEVVFCKMAVVK